MTWRIVEHTDDHFLVEFENGTRLNYNATEMVERRPTYVRHNEEIIASKNGPRMGGTAFVFIEGSVLPEHKHDAATLHTIECVKGKVIVHRAVQGDITLIPGQTAELLVDESHSVTALEDSKTVHWLINS